MTTRQQHREPPPALYMPSPKCPICNYDVVLDGDSWNCWTCLAFWSTDPSSDDAGAWMDDAHGGADTYRCPAEIQPWAGRTDRPDLADEVYRCVLGEAHVLLPGMYFRRHRNPHVPAREWEDHHWTAITPGSTEAAILEHRRSHDSTAEADA